MNTDPVRGGGQTPENKISTPPPQSSKETPKTIFFRESAKKLSGFDNHVIGENYSRWKDLKADIQKTSNDTITKAKVISKKLNIAQHRITETIENKENKENKEINKNNGPNIDFGSLGKPTWKDQ